MLPIFPLMFLIFLTLKLCGVIAWSWWLVFAPLYPAIILGLGCLWVVWVATR
jgi:hypothetical protein